ncbi:MAG: hypothetical protein WKI04_09305 [Ferruginibacter sp.]
MKKTFLISWILLTFIQVHAQKFHLTFFTGIGNYHGDIQSKRFTFQQANLAVGAGAL